MSDIFYVFPRSKVLLSSFLLFSLLFLLLAKPAAAAAFVEWDVPGQTSSVPYDLVHDGNNVWFTEFASDELGRMFLGSFTEFKLPTGSRPWGIAYDGEFIWFTMSIRNAIGRIRSSGESSIVEYQLNPLFNPEPRGIDVYRDGSTTLVWFAEFNRHAIALLNITNNQAFLYEWLLPKRDGLEAGPQTVIYINEEGVSKGAWYVDLTRDIIGHIPDSAGAPDSRGYIREYHLANGADPWDLDVDGYGRIWFSESGRNRIAVLDPNTFEVTEYLIATSSSEPYGLAVDASNKIWFTEHGANKIGRFTPGLNTFTEFSRSESGTPWFITTSSERSIPLWFSESVFNRIGKLEPSIGLTTQFASSLSSASTASTTITASKTTLSTGTMSTAYTTNSTTSITRVITLDETNVGSSSSYINSETVTVLQTSSAEISTITLTSTDTTEFLENTTATSTFYEDTVTATSTVSTTVFLSSTSYIATVTGTFTATQATTTYSTIYLTTTGEASGIPGFNPFSILIGIALALLSLLIVRMKPRLFPSSPLKQ